MLAKAKVEQALFREGRPNFLLEPPTMPQSCLELKNDPRSKGFRSTNLGLLHLFLDRFEFSRQNRRADETGFMAQKGTHSLYLIYSHCCHRKSEPFGQHQGLEDDLAFFVVVVVIWLLAKYLFVYIDG